MKEQVMTRGSSRDGQIMVKKGKPSKGDDQALDAFCGFQTPGVCGHMRQRYPCLNVKWVYHVSNTSTGISSKDPQKPPNDPHTIYKIPSKGDDQGLNAFHDVG